MWAQVRRAMRGQQPIVCEETPGYMQYEGAFPEHNAQAPLSPKMDQDLGYNKYKLFEDTTGPFPGPLPEDFRYFNSLKVSEEKVNQTYEYQLKDHIPLEGPKAPKFSSKWEKLVAYHHGTYVPEMYGGVKTADDIRLAVSDYAKKVHEDGPTDACKYLAIEEFRCLQVYQSEVNPGFAAKKCMKWWDEWQKCQWDQAKFNAGTTYVEGPQMRRRRPYIFYPDFKFA